MLYNMFPNPCQCTKMIIRHLQRRLGGVCFCVPTLLENLRSKNENELGARVGAYCIRPINILSRNILSFKIRIFAASVGICGAYAIRPYHVTGMESEK